MRKIYKIILSVISLVFPAMVFAQNNPTPNLFTGQLNYTIPIYHLDDPDFPLEIALHYQTDGFRPFQPSGFYGLDWSLECGGYIIRSVQGFPDTQHMECQTGWDITKVHWGMYEAQRYYGTCSPDLVYDFDSVAYDTTCGYQYIPDTVESCFNKLDYMPDIFYFNFCGYKGQFMIDNNNQPIILNGNFVYVDISEASETYTQPYPASNNSLYSAYQSKITLKTANGYTYVFGGTQSTVEFSIFAERDRIPNQEYPIISAWHLRKIIAPNGREMNLQYKLSDNSYFDELKFFSVDYDWTEPNDSTHITYTLNKSCLLQSISTSDSLNILFSSSEEAHRRFEREDYEICYAKNLQLDSIVISYGNRRLKSAHLSYSYQAFNINYGVTNNFYWRYLSSVHVSGVGTYSLGYTYVDPYSEQDPPFMHFFVYPNIHVTTNAEYKALVDRFGFWRMTSLQGLLENVSLPTGGKIRFTYGNHDYREERRFHEVNLRDVELYARTVPERTIGGARIEKNRNVFRSDHVGGNADICIR